MFNHIEIIATHDFQEVIKRLRKVTIKGDPRVHPYRQSTIKLREVSPDDLWPCALYVLIGNLATQQDLQTAMKARGIDPLHLTEDCSLVEFNWGDQEGLVLTPPLVEVSEDDGNKEVVVDGLHRVITGRDNGEPTVAVTFVQNIAVPLPSYPVPWAEVQGVETIPPTAAKRKFRFQDKDPETWPDWNERNFARFQQGLNLSNPFAALGLLHTVKR